MVKAQHTSETLLIIDEPKSFNIPQDFNLNLLSSLKMVKLGCLAPNSIRDELRT
jgi:hypothetical protein